MNSTAFRKQHSAKTILPIAHPSKPSAHTPAPELHLLAVGKLQEIGLGSLAAKLRVLWNPRMRSTAGLAYPTTTQIVLNPKLLHFGKEEVERTLLHELAHLVAHHRGGRRRIAPHGTEWRLACIELGLANESRCHNLPLPRRKIARTCIYQCPHCKTQLARVRAFRRPAACMNCCRRLNAGRYDERFKLLRLPDSSSLP
ncbi:MAG: M48 family peptidase [Verrucomicrobia bacterium]|nr:M48 family peptidase [Verrucomicrobiota bacterium]